MTRSDVGLRQYFYSSVLQSVWIFGPVIFGALERFVEKVFHSRSLFFWSSSKRATKGTSRKCCAVRISISCWKLCHENCPVPLEVSKWWRQSKKMVGDCTQCLWHSFYSIISSAVNLKVSVCFLFLFACAQIFVDGREILPTGREDCFLPAYTACSKFLTDR